MRKRLLIVLPTVLALLLLLCACEDSSRREAPGDVIVFNSNIGVFMNSTEKTLTNVYKTEYFRKNGEVFDKELAMLSLPVAAPSDRETAMANIVAMGFDNIKYYWNTDEFPLLCSYIMGHRTVDDSELIVVYLNFVNYDVEWASNLEIGKSGNHYGFEKGSQWVYRALKNYVNEYYPDKPLKLWLTGYSRGGGLSDALAYKILEDKTGEDRVLNVADEDMFAYSFEAPATVTDSAESYPCIHSIIVNSDLIAAMPPGSYGLKHPGEKIVLNGEPDNLNNLLHKYIDPNLSMPVFTKGSVISTELTFNTPEEFVAYVLGRLVAATTEDDYAASFATRDKFYSTVQGRLSYLLQVFMRQRRVGLNTLVSYLSEKDQSELISIFGEWTKKDQDNFYNDLCPILDSCSVIYDEDSLKEACSLLPRIFNNGNLFSFLFFFVDEKFRNDGLYTIYSHCPEVFYVLLKENRFN